MDRPLKFRAWDEFYSKFVYHGDGPEDMEAFWRVVRHGREAGRVVPVTQYTGLHDKNGQEIYEGDIVRFPDQIARYGHVAEDVVKYQEGGFWPFTDPYLPVAIQELEVIGNIYETPNLLA